MDNLSKTYYKPSSETAWTGRIDGHEAIHHRWHQSIKYLNLNHPLPFWNDNNRIDEQSFPSAIVLIGFACDEGVRRNFGRLGAKGGPSAIRAALSNLPTPIHELTLYDAGDICCDGKNLEAAQRHLGVAVQKIIKHGALPIVLGGGHEVTYGQYLGAKGAIGSGKGLGMVNFDAHFDNRTPGVNGPSSGTGFWQIAQDQHANSEKFNYLAVGIQRVGNTAALFQEAQQTSTLYILASDFHAAHEIEQLHQLTKFLIDIDHLYLTIDLDVFAAGYAPGVSAPSVLGIHPDPYFFRYLNCILQSGKLRTVDVAELNPTLDQDQRTAKLAAVLIDYMVHQLKP